MGNIIDDVKCFFTKERVSCFHERTNTHWLIFGEEFIGSNSPLRYIVQMGVYNLDRCSERAISDFHRQSYIKTIKDLNHQKITPVFCVPTKGTELPCKLEGWDFKVINYESIVEQSMSID